MLSRADIDRYNEQGFIVVPDVLSAAEVAELRKATDEMVDGARGVSQNDDTYDLEPGHSASMPRVRRIKTPDKWHPAYAKMPRHPGVIAVLKQLWGPNIRYDLAKLRAEGVIT